jgi:long-chain acyl-CoA synthetase
LLGIVPRLLTRFYGVIKGKLSEKKGLAKTIVDRAVKVKLDKLHKKACVTDWFYDTLIFGKMKKVLGGKVRLMVTGSAPIDQ